MAENTSADDPQSMFEQEPIIDIFGESGALRVLRVLVDGWGLPLTVSDIADQADVDPQTVYNNIDTLIEYGFAEEADQVGNATRYRLVPESETTQAFTQLVDTLIDAPN